MNISLTSNTSTRMLTNDTNDDGTYSTAYYVLSVTANCIVTLFILVNNCLILLTLVKTKKLHTLPNAYVASLTVADLLLGILLIVRNFWLLPSTEWFFNEHKFVCIPFMCLLYINALESLFCLVLVSFDRYMFIAHPFWYNRNVNARVVSVLILISWCFSVPFGCLPLWLNNFTKEKGCNPIRIISRPYLLGQFVFFILSAIAIAFMYGWIYFIMRRQHRKTMSAFRMTHALNALDSHSNSGQTMRLRNPGQNRYRVIRFLIFVCATFFVCWTPAAVVLPMEILGLIDIPEIVITITVSIAALNSACNMFAFIVMNPDFRHALSKLLCPRKHPKHSIEPSIATVHDNAVIGRGASSRRLNGGDAGRGGETGGSGGSLGKGAGYGVGCWRDDSSFRGNECGNCARGGSGSDIAGKGGVVHSGGASAFVDGRDIDGCNGGGGNGNGDDDADDCGDVHGGGSSFDLKNSENDSFIHYGVASGGNYLPIDSSTDTLPDFYVETLTGSSTTDSNKLKERRLTETEEVVVLYGHCHCHGHTSRLCMSGEEEPIVVGVEEAQRGPVEGEEDLKEDEGIGRRHDLLPKPTIYSLTLNLPKWMRIYLD